MRIQVQVEVQEWVDVGSEERKVQEKLLKATGRKNYWNEQTEMEGGSAEACIGKEGMNEGY